MTEVDPAAELAMAKQALAASNRLLKRATIRCRMLERQVARLVEDLKANGLQIRKLLDENNDLRARLRLLDG